MGPILCKNRYAKPYQMLWTNQKKKNNKNKKIPLTSNDRFASCLVMSGVTEMN